MVKVNEENQCCVDQSIIDRGKYMLECKHSVGPHWYYAQCSLKAITIKHPNVKGICKNCSNRC